MGMSDRVKCRRCGAYIRFIDLPSGKKMPVDSACLRVYETSRADFFYTREGRRVEGLVTPREDLPRTPCYRPHFASCRGKRQ